MKKIKGFTLVELVIVIMVVIILSTISVPLYQGHVKKAMMTEGYAFIAQIRDAQFQYRAEYGTFFGRGGSNYTCNDAVLNINGRLNKYFTEFNSNLCNGNDGSSKYNLKIGLVKPRELGGGYLGLYYSLTGISYYAENWHYCNW